MDKPWKFNRLGELSPWRFKIIDGHGRAICLRVDKNRFQIHGIFLNGRALVWNKNYKTIGVSIARPAKDIAADIKRRLLPHYLEAFEEAIARYQEEQAKEDNLNYIAASLQKVTGGRIADHGRSSRTVFFDNGAAEIWSTDEIEMTFHRLIPEEAIRLVGFLE